jgi:polyphosphate glucokinase
MQAFGIDIGGTGIKGALVNLDDGSLVGERQKVKTPEGAPIDAVLDAVEELRGKILAQPEASGSDYSIGMCMPSVVRRGVALSAANIADEWIGFEAAKAFSERLGTPVSLINDADAAGYGEVMFGHAKDAHGALLVITLGTGIGSALIHNGNLVPNTELGHLSLGKHGDYEKYASAKVREKEDLPLKHWAKKRLTPYFAKLEQLFSPDLFIVSGGISKRADEFLPFIDVPTRIDAAQLTNNAGIVGAALLAEEGWT